METGRLEAFSDGVIAVIITIMVLELKVPHGTDLRALRSELPTFVAYVLSFINVGIYWNNHHHMLKATKRIDGRSMWANLHLLFWLSLVPLTTAWAGENHLAPVPTAAYGFVLMMAAIAWTLLQTSLVACNGNDSRLAHAIGNDWKGKASLAAYIVSIAAAFVAPIVSAALIVAVAALWLIPDRRIERVTADDEAGANDASAPSIGR
jgi:uncharacterized membrane protein